MAVKPTELNDLKRPDVQKRILKHEKDIDNFLHENYTTMGDDLPPYKLVEDMSAVTGEIIRRYTEAGWDITPISAGSTARADEVLLHFKVSG